MSPYHISIWRRSSNKLRQNEVWLECFCLIGLLVAASVLFLINLSSLPLLDAGEATLAQTAKEVYSSSNFTDWIFYNWGNGSNLAQPPIGQDLVAIAYRLGGIGELTTRFPGALLAAFSVLLVYQIGRELFVIRLPALFSALVYLTCLPVVRYGRLATLDGPLLCFELLTIWAVLRSRRDLKWTLGIGIGLSLIALTQGFTVLPALAIVLLFLFWDTPRLLNSTYFWSGLLIGALPGVLWHGAFLIYHHHLAMSANLLNLFWVRTEPYSLPQIASPGYYLLRAGQYIIPWPIVGFAGLKSLKHNLHWGWGKLLTVWVSGYFIFACLVFEQNSGVILPLYPALALAAGKQLDRIRTLPSFIIYPRSWIYSFAAMAVVAALAGLNWGIRNYVDFYLPFICGSLCITFSATAIAISQQDKQFIPLLFWGLLVSIFLLVVSPHWIWELQSLEPVKPIAERVKQHTPPQAVIYGSTTTARPSLNFYSDRQIIPQSLSELEQHWQKESLVYLLLDIKIFQQLGLPPTATIEDERLKSLGWILVVKNRSSVLANLLEPENSAEQ